MNTVLVLAGWMLLCAMAGWHPQGRGRASSRLALALCLLSLLLAGFWSHLARALPGPEALPIAGPEAAWLSLWVLALLPILRRRLDAPIFGAMALSGLAAAAAFGLALDSLALIDTAISTAPVWFGPNLARVRANLLGPLVHAALALAGLTMRQLMSPTDNQPDPSLAPWDYAAWYLGLITMYQGGSG